MMLTSEHGKPPVHTVAFGISQAWRGPTPPPEQIVFRSPRFGMFGQCDAWTAIANGLTSE